MKFKKWFYTNEMKKPYRNYLRRIFPNMPEPVRHELGTNTVIPQLKKIASSSPPKDDSATNGNGNSYDPYGATVYKPYKSKISTKNAPTTYHKPEAPYSSPGEMLDKDEKIRKFRSVNWPDEPEIVRLHLNSFSPETQDTIKHLRFGFSANIPVKRHQQRMGDQEKLMRSREPEEMEPIIMIQTPEGLELLEGWHRVFNYLLSGAPSEVAAALKDGSINAHQVDYDEWKPIKIRAFIGRPKKVA